MLPIVTRELKQAARRPRSYRNRIAGAVLAVVIAAGVLSPSFRGVVPPTETGRVLFFILSLVPFACVLLAGAYVTADSLSEEKRNGTLGLLFLTDLRGYDVVFGKLMATSLNGLYALLAIVPVLAVPLLLGGIMVGEFWRMVLVLLNTFFWSLAIGIFVSSFSKDGRAASLVTTAVILVSSLGPWLAVKLATTFSPSAADPAILMFSPIYTCWLAFDTPFNATAARFWWGLEWQHLIAWLFLIGACLILPRGWQERAPSGWRLRAQELWQRSTLGTTDQRQADRRKWLERNPILWLAQRERHRRAFFWGFLGLFAGAWLFGYVTASDLWAEAETTFILAFVLHLIIKVWLALEATRRLSEEKRSGALELLLVTPVGVPNILSGVLSAAKRQFLVPLIFVLLTDTILLTFGLNAAGAQTPSELSIIFLAFVGMFVADCYALVWIGLWLGLKAKNSTQAFLLSLLQVLFLPWLIFVLVGSAIAIVFFGGSGVIPFGGWMVATWFAVAYFLDALLCGRAMARLTDQFRPLAAQTYLMEQRSFWRRMWRTK